MIKIAINGFGRIGRSFLRALFSDINTLEKIDVVALNIGPAKLEWAAHSFIYDSSMGTFTGSVVLKDTVLYINDHPIKIYTEKDPLALDWKKDDIDWVVDCSGKFTKKVDAQKHISAGARHVLISAPSQDADVTVILGVNDAAFKGQQIVSLGSCTTNAVAPIFRVLQETCGIESAFMTTVHAYTNDQVLLDVEGSDIRRSRAAALNIVPTTTGALKTVALVMPELAGKLSGCSLRVPVAKVSLVDLSFVMGKKITIPVLHDAFIKASNADLKTVMQFTDQELVSSDYAQNSHSVIIDGSLTQIVGSLGKVFGWYDNEWGYSCRLKDFLLSFSA